MAFTITVVFIVLSTVVAAFVRGRCRDKCLKDFEDDTVTFQAQGGKEVRGRLRVENTGLEFIYKTTHKDSDGHDENSFILYKNEFSGITALIRFHGELSEANRKQRDKELRRTYHPTILRRLKRKILNVFKTIKDSVMEVVNLLISQAKKTSPAGAMLSSQDKYVSRMKQELISSPGTSYEPLIERYIGHKVVMDMNKADKTFEYCGVLKDYTAEFIEIMDVDYKIKEDQAPRKADLIVPRKYGIIRHLAEHLE